MAATYRSLLRWLCALTAAILIGDGPANAYDWLQFGGDMRHSASNVFETALTHTNVNSLAPKYQVTLPATVDGSPVYLEAVTTASGVKDLLFVTTTAGHIIALDAQTGAQAWSHQYGPGSCRINNTSGPCYTTSSPAVDPNRQYVYSYGLDGYVHKYLVGDGAEITGGGWPEVATTKGFDEKGSSALSFATSGATTYLYVTHGGYPGDQGDYQGHVTAIELATGLQKVFNTACSDQAVHFQPTTITGATPTCPTRQNAIWSRPGVVYDAGTDRIFIGTGNAFSAALGQFDGNHNWSESVIALHPDGSGGTAAIAGKPLDSYTPTNHVSLDASDADIGSTAPAILPVPPTSVVQHLAVQSGKDAKLRLLNLANLSNQGGPGHTAGEVAPIIDVPQGGGVLSQPAVWTNPADNSTWVFIVNASGASALRLSVDGSGNPSLLPQWSIAQGGTSPIVVNSIVFYVDGGTVRAVDAVSSIQLWSVANPGGTHWQSLIVANGRLYATDGAGHLNAFALPAPVSTTTMLISSPNPSTVGTSITFTATVTGAAPTGSVSFSDSGAPIAGCAAATLGGTGISRTATCTTASLTVGAHSIVAAYGGDADHTGSSSALLAQVVNSTVNLALLVDHYYQAILGRAPDPAGEAFWESEAARMQSLGVDVKEAFMVMAGFFFNSAEYLNRNTSDAQYVTDLYNAFFNRVPDADGLAYWTGQIAAGLPRSIVMYGFMFSPEFNSFMTGLFGNTSSRAEVYAVVDFYRGILNRLPDNSGFAYWLTQFRAAQCWGAAAVYNAVASISSQFIASDEYVGRNRNNTDYVGDLYYAFLRRGGDLLGVTYWINRLNTGAETRDQMRTDFINTPEFNGRVNAIIAQGCSS